MTISVRADVLKSLLFQFWEPCRLVFCALWHLGVRKFWRLFFDTEHSPYTWKSAGVTAVRGVDTQTLLPLRQLTSLRFPAESELSGAVPAVTAQITSQLCVHILFPQGIAASYLFRGTRHHTHTHFALWFMKALRLKIELFFWYIKRFDQMIRKH